jgi:hypothetical protein
MLLILHNFDMWELFRKNTKKQNLQNHMSVVVQNHMSVVVLYVPFFVWNGAHDFGGESHGVYKTEKEAVRTLLAHIVRRGYSSAEGNESAEADLINASSLVTTAEELKKFCQEHGDSWFRQSWDFCIQQHVLAL